LGTTTFSIMTLSITTVRKMNLFVTLSITKLNIMKLSITILSARCRMLNVIMLDVILLNVMARSTALTGIWNFIKKCS
jgi:hypothetical protein